MPKPRSRRWKRACAVWEVERNTTVVSHSFTQRGKGGAQRAQRERRVVHRVARREGIARPYVSRYMSHRGKGSPRGVDRVAAPLLGGVRGWVYLQDTHDQGISARYKIILCKTFRPFALVKDSSSGYSNITCLTEVNPPPNPSEEGSRNATPSRNATRTAMRPYARHAFLFAPLREILRENC